jgi:hypothetical protein
MFLRRSAVKRYQMSSSSLVSGPFRELSTDLVELDVDDAYVRSGGTQPRSQFISERITSRWPGLKRVRDRVGAQATVCLILAKLRVTALNAFYGSLQIGVRGVVGSAQKIKFRTLRGGVNVLAFLSCY